ncbi:Asp23/Gls24 family envelope stress response protein [Pseudonocardia sp. TRM90224]|uniref:Asp23/Gls24 family envelope stress response protein n=1 Tax=Pseudonocardia sp. TRM90224 TaxID=2812678 RepID=UPI001E4E94A3|nr:Asp23/Gls24 family envelope stress response protein [Pseudonocardia sp. TRM90224]
MAVNETTGTAGPDDGGSDDGGAPELLPCGRDAATVWDRAEAGVPPDEHERDCPYCTATAADAMRLDAVVHRMAAAPVEPPPAVLERAMDKVRGALARDLREHELLTLASPLGPVRLSRAAAATVLRDAVDRMGDVRARSCQVEQNEQIDAGTTVAMTVSALYGVDMRAVAARVRRMVIAAGTQALGLPVGAVDVTVVDVFGEGDA